MFCIHNTGQPGEGRGSERKKGPREEEVIVLHGEVEEEEGNQRRGGEGLPAAFSALRNLITRLRTFGNRH